MKIFSALLIVTHLLVLSPGSAYAKDEIKVSELLEEVNKTMTEAQEIYVDGDSDKAISLYRKALVEIKKIEMQHQDRVTSSEFAPLRFRRALCETEIDRLLLEQVSIASRTVAVTDTRELEQKRLQRQKEAQTNQFAKVSTKLSAKGDSGIIESKTVAIEQEADETKASAPQDDKTQTPPEKFNVEMELDWIKDLIEVEKYEDADKSLIKVLRADPDNFKGRYLMALVRIRLGKYEDAQIVVEDLTEDYEQNEAVLMLAAGVYATTQQYPKAMTMLDKALKIAPKRPEGYLNMAWLLLDMNPAEISDPEMYYRRSVELGGARDVELEKRLGIKQK